MSNPKPAVGTVSWTDLTVPEAKRISGFYEAVVGWKPVPLDMGGYSDFCMKTPAEGKTVAGICHAKGNNANLPAQWLIYITVADLEASLRKCQAKAGKLLGGIRELGSGRFAVIQDPAGAVAALFEPTGANKKRSPRRRGN